MDKNDKQKKNKKDDSLTLPQETFVQELIKGLTQRKAYLVAYPKRKRWKDETVDNKASKLFAKSEIKARFGELKQQLVYESDKKTIMDAKEILRLYTKIARGEEEEEVFVSDMGMSMKKTKKPSIKDRIKAIERLDKILGMERNYENDTKTKDDGLTKQIEKIANSDIWEGFEDDTADK